MMPRLIILLSLFLPTVSSLSAKPSFNYDLALAEEVQQRILPIIEQASAAEEQEQLVLDYQIQLRGDQVIERTTSVVYYPDKASIEDGSETLYWDAQVEKTNFLVAGVLTKDQQFIPFDKANLRIVDTDSYNTFTDEKQLILAFNGLESQAATIVVRENTSSFKDLESNWSFSVYPVGYYKTHQFTLAVQATDAKLAWSNSDDRIECESTVSKLVCRAENLSPYPYSQNENWRDFIAQIFVSTETNWQAVADDSRQKFDTALKRGDGFKKLSSTLFSDSADLIERIHKAHEFVARDIRYVSMSELGHRVTPHNIESVIENRFGDCKDKSALLVALLRSQGVDAFPVLVATKQRDVSRLEVPSSRYFDHMVVCFKLEDKEFCIDATDGSTAWNGFSSWIIGRASLPLTEQAEPARLGQQNIRWQADYQTTFTFDAQGNQVEETVRSFVGPYAGDVRDSYRGATGEQQQKWAVKHYQDNISSDIKPEVSFRYVDDLTNSFEIITKASFDPFLSSSELSDYSEKDHWMRYELKGFKMKNSVGPAEFDGLQITTVNKIDMGERWQIRKPPPNFKYRFSYGTMTREVTTTAKNQAEVRTKLIVPRQRIEVDEKDQFNEFLDRLAEQTIMRFKLRDLKPEVEAE